MNSKHDLVLSLRNVGTCYWIRKGYLKKQRFWALKDVSFDLYHGETLGIIGRNGAGKSTLLQTLAGIIHPDQGQIINNGARVSLLSLRTGFIPYLTGRENAILSGMLLGLHKSEIEEKMDEIIEFSELGDFFHEPINTYSSGMQARLAFSIAFQLDPDVLLIDEILGVGDEQFRRKSTNVMHEKIRSNKTIVLVSHQLNNVKQLCNRVVWIENGSSKLEGSPDDVLTAYRQFINKN